MGRGVETLMGNGGEGIKVTEEAFSEPHWTPGSTHTLSMTLSRSLSVWTSVSPSERWAS